VILADRYRIIGLLGRGGMGEVYRADDLKLGQPVALKFLPRAFSEDAVRRERFFAEVRITRGLAHPNICRVYDIAEIDGQHFLSMEYIDGENLASLIQRIGYLSNEKALDLARQLAAGLAAAHERGVLHRDLKPANIMIDGHGRVRITDFGLAIAAGEDTQSAEMFGTPAYMAPEQFAGKGSSVRSDIYALGLIFYEIYSGKKAFKATSLAELRAQKEGQPPTAPSEINKGVDPVVERVIMRCLERDPRNRPSSAAQLVAALPGGDPLAAALAAGETPSPEMVAAAGEKEGLRPVIAWSLLAWVILGSVLLAAMKDRTDLFQRLKPSKSPDAIVERAREFIKNAGYSDVPADTELNLQFDTDFLNLQFNGNTDSFPIPWNSPSAVSPGVFVYRESPQPLEPSGLPMFRLFGNSIDPSLAPGDIMVRLDTEGRLRAFRAIPTTRDAFSLSASTTDWSGIFSDAGLDISNWAPTTPLWRPESYADTRAAWVGTLSDAPGIPIRIEAASLQGKPVSFTVMYPWTQLERTRPELTPYVKVAYILFAVISICVFVLPIFFARRNLRLGRGDRRGANRMAVALAVLPLTLFFVLAEHHVTTGWEVGLFALFLAGTLLGAGALWTIYIALEPFVRRRWPQLLVSWTRALSGEWRDPLVGRDVLIGCAAGLAGIALSRSNFLVYELLGYPERGLFAIPLIPGFVSGTSSFVGKYAFLIPFTIVLIGLFQMFFFLLLRALFRKDWLAVLIWLLFLALPDPVQLPWIGLWPVVIANLLSGILAFTVQMRFGLLASTTAAFAAGTSNLIPTTLQGSWYAGYGYAALAVIIALAIYGFRTSLAGRPLLTFSGIDSEPSVSR
jgi:serine/threonine-protein kinase